MTSQSPGAGSRVLRHNHLERGARSVTLSGESNGAEASTHPYEAKTQDKVNKWAMPSHL